jgi:diguanylate cyclase (GGDEF)-like protein
MEKEISILILDDNDKILETLKDILGEEGYKITVCSNIEQARMNLSRKFYNLALIDLRLSQDNGLDLLKEIKKKNEDTAVVIFSVYASLESALEAMKDGAYGYLQKPLNMDELKITIRKALKEQELSLENERLIGRLKELSLKDSLTGLYNYRYLIERMSSEFKRARRYILPLSIIMLDIDYFKSLNEVYGHQYGDLILKEFAGYLKKCARTNDIVIRYGGEEFVVLMPDTDKNGAVVFGSRLLEFLKEHIFDRGGNRVKLKISMGVASLPENGIDSSASLLSGVDKAMRQAKESGGNQLSLFRAAGAKEIKDILKDGGKGNVEKLKTRLWRMKNRTNQILLESIFAFAKAVEARDFYTGKHSENMVSAATEIGRHLRLSQREIDNLRHAAMLHDLGKIGVEDRILRKRSAFTPQELEKIRRHPQIGAEIIRDIHFLKEVVPMIMYHHERFDGLGYSMGLKGKEIPLGARIIAIADVYQALISNRPYRKAYSKTEALKIIKDGSGTQFDPAIVKVFLQIMQKKKQIVR